MARISGDVAREGMEAVRVERPAPRSRTTRLALGVARLPMRLAPFLFVYARKDLRRHGYLPGAFGVVLLCLAALYAVLDSLGR